jgi:hypothetical protein
MEHKPEYNNEEDLPLEVIDLNDETLQTLQYEDFEEHVEGEEWISKANAAIKVYSHIYDLNVPQELQEQYRTTAAKERFIEAYDVNMGNISQSCEGANISRESYYAWIKADAQFRLKLKEIDDKMIDLVDDKIKALMNRGDATTIRWWAERRDPKYKSKNETEIVVAGMRTFEDLAYEQAMKRKSLLNENNVIDAQVKNG